MNVGIRQSRFHNRYTFFCEDVDYVEPWEHKKKSLEPATPSPSKSSWPPVLKTCGSFSQMASRGKMHHCLSRKMHYVPPLGGRVSWELHDAKELPIRTPGEGMGTSISLIRWWDSLRGWFAYLRCYPVLLWELCKDTYNFVGKLSRTRRKEREMKLPRFVAEVSIRV